MTQVDAVFDGLEKERKSLQNIKNHSNKSTLLLAERVLQGLCSTLSASETNRSVGCLMVLFSVYDVSG